MRLETRHTDSWFDSWRNARLEVYATVFCSKCIRIIALLERQVGQVDEIECKCLIAYLLLHPNWGFPFLLLVNNLLEIFMWWSHHSAQSSGINPCSFFNFLGFFAMLTECPVALFRSCNSVTLLQLLVFRYAYNHVEAGLVLGSVWSSTRWEAAIPRCNHYMYVLNC